MDILLIKLIASLISGFLIGVDRQIKHKPLGLKTSMVICIASCLMTIVSIEAVAKYASEHTPNMDPMRLAAQVVSGVGFLGAGVILRRSNDVISGLTTATISGRFWTWYCHWRRVLCRGHFCGDFNTHGD